MASFKPGPRRALGPESLRKEVQAFKPYVAGRSIDEIKARYGLDNVVKLASNENPLGTSPVVQRVLGDRAGLAFRYPQTGNPRLLEAIGNHIGHAPERIVVGNGSDELIDLLVRVKAEPGVHNVLAFEPCFSMYKLQSLFHGVEFRQVPLNKDFTFPWDDFLDAADEHTAVAFVTTPDNPSGYTPPVAEIEALALALPENCLLVVDEAYMDFAAPLEDYSLMGRLDEFPNVCILRTFSKLFGLAGLRIGYGVMPEWLADHLWRVRLPFSVNILAEEAAIAALADTDFINATYETVARGRDFLTRELEALGCCVQPSMANFLLFTLPDDTTLDANDVFEQLLAMGMIIRPLASYDLPDSLRVTVGTEQENRLLVECLKKVLA